MSSKKPASKVKALYRRKAKMTEERDDVGIRFRHDGLLPPLIEAMARRGITVGPRGEIVVSDEADLDSLLLCGRSLIEYGWFSKGDVVLNALSARTKRSHVRLFSVSELYRAFSGVVARGELKPWRRTLASFLRRKISPEDRAIAFDLNARVVVCSRAYRVAHPSMGDLCRVHEGAVKAAVKAGLAPLVLDLLRRLHLALGSFYGEEPAVEARQRKIAARIKTLERRAHATPGGDVFLPRRAMQLMERLADGPPEEERHRIFDEAFKVYEQCGHIGGSFDVTMTRADAATQSQRVPEGLAGRERALQMATVAGFDVGAKLASLGIAEAALRLGELERAREIYRTLADEPLLTPLLLLLGVPLAAGLSSVGLDAQATMIIEKVIKHRLFRHIPELAFPAYMVAANVASASQNLSRAIRYTEQAARCAPGPRELAQAVCIEVIQRVSAARVSGGGQLDRAGIAIARRCEQKVRALLAQVPLGDDGMACRGLYCQALAQIALAANDRRAALLFLGESRNGFVAAQDPFSVASVDTMVALLLRQLGPAAGPDITSQIQWHLAQAREGFLVAGRPTESAAADKMLTEISFQSETPTKIVMPVQ